MLEERLLYNVSTRVFQGETPLLPSVEDRWNDLERTSGQVTLRFRLMSS